MFIEPERISELWELLSVVSCDLLDDLSLSLATVAAVVVTLSFCSVTII